VKDLAWVFVTVLLFIPSLAIGAEFTSKVVRVIDGDSIAVMHEGKAEQVRLNGIDCPEKGQAFGKKVKQVTSSMVFGRDVTVKPKTTDRYGRMVGEVTLPDGRSLNGELVKQCWCWWFRKYAPNDTVLRELEATARKQRLGVWADPQPVQAIGQLRLSEAGIIGEATTSAIAPGGIAEPLTRPILGNWRSHIYHRADCPNYSEIAEHNQVAFVSESAAQQVGYRIAGNCP
jgi:endonuclease YncB( thermonuclease family)